MDSLAMLPERIRQLSEAHAAGHLGAAAFLENCARLVAAQIGCARAGIWHFVENDDGEQVLRSLAMYDVASDRMVSVPDYQDSGAYFLALAHTGYVNACDASNHFATTGRLAQRLSSRGIQSLLAASLAVNGKVYGALTCTEVDRPLEWSGWQVTAVRRAAGRIAVSLFAERSGAWSMSTVPYASSGG